MIFSEKSIKEILEGRKTQTRRLVKAGETYCRCRFNNLGGHVQKSMGKVKWQVGKEYSVQPSRGKPAVWYETKIGYFKLKIKIIGIRRERLLEISELGAKKEGFNDRNKFLDAFDELNRKAIPKQYKLGLAFSWNPDVWVLDFKKVTRV